MQEDRYRKELTSPAAADAETATPPAPAATATEAATPVASPHGLAATDTAAATAAPLPALQQHRKGSRPEQHMNSVLLQLLGGLQTQRLEQLGHETGQRLAKKAILAWKPWLE